MFEFINCHGTFILFWIEDGKAWVASARSSPERVWRYSYRPCFVPLFEASFPKEEQRRIWEIVNPEKIYQPAGHDGSWRRVSDKLSPNKDELWYVGATTKLVRLYERGTKIVCTNPRGEAWRPTEADQREAIQALAPEWLPDLSASLNQVATQKIILRGWHMKTNPFKIQPPLVCSLTPKSMLSRLLCKCLNLSKGRLLNPTSIGRFVHQPSGSTFHAFSVKRESKAQTRCTSFIRVSNRCLLFTNRCWA